MPAKKKTIKKKVQITKKSNSLDIKKLELLIDNTVVLQKIFVSLAESNNKLNDKIGSLLSLFENASKSIDRIKEVESKDVEELAKKLEDVVTQNKDLAEGIVALEKYIKIIRGDTQLNPKPLFK